MLDGSLLHLFIFNGIVPDFEICGVFDEECMARISGAHLSHGFQGVLYDPVCLLLPSHRSFVHRGELDTLHCCVEAPKRYVGDAYCKSSLVN